MKKGFFLSNWRFHVATWPSRLFHASTETTMKAAGNVCWPSVSRHTHLDHLTE